jgi:putative transposase
MSHAQQLHNRRYFDDYLEIINRHGLPGNVKHEVCQQVRDAVITTVQTVIEHALREELATYLGCARYAHLPCGRTPESTLSGSYSRTLMTQYGGIPALHVPKLRRGNGARTWQTITRYEHCWGPLLDQHILGYCLGLSLRDLQEVMQVTLGEMMSLAACNRLVLTVQEQVSAFKTTPLDAPPPIVLVDGMWVKIASPTGESTDDARGRHRQAKRQQKRVVLTALGVWPDGHWEIVHWQIAPGETAKTWQAFFGDLYRKGITEQTTALVVSDGSTGLESALDHHLYGVPHQRCIFHKIKQLADHLVFHDLPLEGTTPDDKATRKAKRRRKNAILADASWVYAGDGEADIRARAEAFGVTWHAQEPEAVVNFAIDFEKTLSYCEVHFPQSCVSLIRTTNLLERFHKEMRRKQRDIGMFQSEQGCDVLWYLLSMRETAKQRASLVLRR